MHFTPDEKNAAKAVYDEYSLVDIHADSALALIADVRDAIWKLNPPTIFGIGQPEADITMKAVAFVLGTLLDRRKLR